MAWFFCVFNVSLKTVCAFLFFTTVTCSEWEINTTQNIKFSINDFFSKSDQIRRKLRNWSSLLKKYLMENFIFFTVKY